jgi:hypothetical protein
MKCQACKEIVVSQLLAEIDTIVCESCHQTVPVQDVMVSANGFTFHRNDLLKRLFRYKTLLNEVSIERALLEDDPHASAESKKSLDQFLQALREVMAGARNRLRLDFTEDVPVKFHINGQEQAGNLTNLSTTGACISAASFATLPKQKGAITLQFSLPVGDGLLTLSGTVSWVRKTGPGGLVGIEFKNLEETVADALWGFIASSG